ncbi:MAG TPA: hypothetical protein VFF27_08365, partial [Bacteroidia bacterium]|nr:hypothetical protein [Bacteroidia bacterium]
KENLLKFTFLIIDRIEQFHKENIEIQIRNCFDQKAIEWQVKTFYYEKGFCLDRTYTFFLMPDWTFQLFYEHVDGEHASCKKIIRTEQQNKTLYDAIISFLNYLNHYYQMTGREGLVNRYLNSANWKVIFAKSVKEEQVKVAESRIQEYLKRITKPLSSFKD